MFNIDEVRVLLHFYMILAGNGVEKIVDLQVSLSSLKRECVALNNEEQKKALLPEIDRCLSDCCTISWKARSMKVETITRNEQTSNEIKEIAKKLEIKGTILSFYDTQLYMPTPNLCSITLCCTSRH